MIMGMDMGFLRGLVTVVLFGAFSGLLYWVYIRAGVKDFDEAAHLPLNDSERETNDE